MAATAETLYTRNSRDVFSRIIAMYQNEGIAAYRQQQNASKSGTQERRDANNRRDTKESRGPCNSKIGTAGTPEKCRDH
jgi:hypothetical protein